MNPGVTGDERFYPTEEIRESLEVYKNSGVETLGKYNEIYLEF